MAIHDVAETAEVAAPTLLRTLRDATLRAAPQGEVPLKVSAYEGRAPGTRLSEGQQAPWIADQDGVDLVGAVAALLHHRHDVAEDVAIAVAAEAREPGAVADVVTDHDAVEMALVDQGADQAQPRRVVRHVDVGQPVVARFLAEQVE